MDATRLVPRTDTRWFRHELTPAWLATTALLAGLEPPDLQSPCTAVWIGCDAPLTPLVAAAVHPNAHVVAWDPDPTKLALIRRSAERADLPNLAVHEEPVPPGTDDLDELGPRRRVDLIVLDGSLDSTDDEGRGGLVDAAAALIRPGGLIAAAYRTRVGWGEITPIVDLVRHMAARRPGNPEPGVAEAIDLLGGLAAGGDRYIANRPVVRAWVNELIDTKVEDVVDRYVRRPLHPLSHARLAEEMAAFGATHVGTATPRPLGAPHVPDGAAALAEGADSPILREALEDIAGRRAHRVDLYSPGPVPLSPRVRSARLRSLQVTAFEVEGEEGLHDDPHRRHGLWNQATRRGLEAGPVTVGDLWPDDRPADRDEKLRDALGAGLLHPVGPDLLGRRTDPDDPATRLTAVLTSTAVPIDHRHVVVPALSSAVPAAGIDDPDRWRTLGADR